MNQHLHTSVSHPASRRQRGVTLIELIISIVIIGIAAAAILGVYTTVIRASADPMIRAQAIAIAEMYMDEIMGRPFSGTSAGDSDCTGRGDWDNIDAYDGLSCPPKAVNGDTLTGLDNYTVNVVVDDFNDLGLSPDERRIEVQVADDAGTVDITLKAWRTR